MVSQPVVADGAIMLGDTPRGRAAGRQRVGRALFVAVLLLTLLLPLDFRGFLMAAVTAAVMMALLELVQLSRRLAAARWPLIAFAALMLGLGSMAVASATPPPVVTCQTQAAAPAAAQTPAACPHK